MSTTNCKDCAAPIGFVRGNNGRWRPVNAGTQTFHRCKLPQICDNCLEHFEGAPWMNLCPTCFKDNQPGRAGFRKESGNFGQTPTRRTKAGEQRRIENAAINARPREEVDDNMDDIPL